MTKVQIHYPLTRQLEDADLDAISRIHAYYGIVHVKIAPALDSLTVDFDASRLSSNDVESALQRFGVPVARI